VVSRRKTLKTAQNPYDTVAYPGKPYPETHPDRLAAMALLHGLSPAPVERCRVLEIACGDGANLIPMAYAIPGSEFVGFDLARSPIERGQGRIGELGLSNVRLFVGDLLDVGEELGEFDYIVAHGIYAWAPDNVRDRLLALCDKLLAPHGIVFVSYNALPGGYLRSMLRDVMLFRTADVEDPIKKVTEAFKFLHFLVESMPEDDVYRQLIEIQLKRMERRAAAATCHDEMGDVFQPVSFYEFARHAQKHGLQYLCEASLPPPTDPSYRAEVCSAVESAAGGDPLRHEQLLDFVRMRMYRESLLCKAGCVPRRDFPAQHLQHLLFASQAEPVPGQAPGSTAFVLPGGVIKMESNHPAVTSLLLELAKHWPHALSFEDLGSTFSEAGLALEGQGATLLVRLAISKMIELRAWDAPMAHAITERPKASACSRQEACTQERATSLLHMTVSLEDAKLRTLLRLLDGTRNRIQLLEGMREAFPKSPYSELDEGLNPSLRLFFRAGLLEA